LKKAFLLTFFVLNIFVIAYAQNPQKPKDDNLSLNILANAQTALDNKNYGEAYKLVQQAQDARKKEVEWNDYVLSKSLKPSQVRKAGDAIDDVLKVLKERDDFDAISIITHWVDLKTKSFFKDSVSNLHKYLLHRIDFPESDFLLGHIYRLEGEYAISEKYLEKANQNSDMLEIPEMRYDILYEQAELAYVQGKNPEYFLQLIIKNDIYYSDDNLKKAVIRTISSTHDDIAQKFFMLYRVDSPISIKAYYKLSAFYAANKKPDDALFMNLLGVLSSFTHINNILLDRNPNYTYTTIESFFYELQRYHDVMTWCIDNDFWKGICTTTLMCKSMGYEVFSKELLESMSEYCPSEYWKEDAFQQLKAYQ